MFLVLNIRHSGLLIMLWIITGLGGWLENYWCGGLGLGSYYSCLVMFAMLNMAGFSSMVLLLIKNIDINYIGSFAKWLLLVCKNHIMNKSELLISYMGGISNLILIFYSTLFILIIYSLLKNKFIQVENQQVTAGILQCFITNLIKSISFNIIIFFVLFPLFLVIVATTAVIYNTLYNILAAQPSISYRFFSPVASFNFFSLQPTTHDQIIYSFILFIFVMFIFLSILNSFFFQIKYWFTISPVIVFFFIILFIISVCLTNIVFLDYELLRVFTSLILVVCVFFLIVLVRRFLVRLRFFYNFYNIKIAFNLYVLIYICISLGTILLLIYSVNFYVSDYSSICARVVWTMFITFDHIYSYIWHVNFYWGLYRVGLYIIVLMFYIYNISILLVRPCLFVHNLTFYIENINSVIPKSYIDKFNNLSFLCKLFAFFNISKYGYYGVLARFNIYYRYASNAVFRLIIYICKIVALYFIIIYTEIYFDKLQIYPEPDLWKSVLIFYIITTFLRIFFSMNTTVVNNIFKLYWSSQIKRAKSNISLFTSNILNKEISGIYALTSRTYLRLIFVVSGFCAFLLFLMLFVYTLLCFLFDYDIDYSLIRLEEDYQVFYRIFGILHVIFGFIFSISIFEWLLLFYFWEISYLLWFLYVIVILLLVPFACLFSDLNSLNIVSYYIKYIFGNTGYRWGKFLRPPKYIPDDVPADIVMIGDWKWFPQPKFLFFDELSSVKMIPWPYSLAGTFIWLIIAILLLFIYFRLSKYSDTNTVLLRNKMKLKHIFLLIMINMLRLYIFINFVYVIFNIDLLFSGGKIDIIEYKSINSLSFNAFVFTYIFSALLFVFSISFHSVIACSLFFLFIIFFLVVIFIFPAIFKVSAHNSYSSILFHIQDTRFRNVILRGLVLMNREFERLTFIFKINFILKIIMLILLNREKTFGSSFHMGLDYFTRYLWLNMVLDALRKCVDIPSIVFVNCINLFIFVSIFYNAPHASIICYILIFVSFCFLLLSHIILYEKYIGNINRWILLKNCVQDMTNYFFRPYAHLATHELPAEKIAKFNSLDGSPGWAIKMNEYFKNNKKIHDSCIENTLFQLSNMLRSEPDIAWERVLTMRRVIDASYADVLNYLDVRDIRSHLSKRILYDDRI